MTASIAHRMTIEVSPDRMRVSCPARPIAAGQVESADVLAAMQVCGLPVTPAVEQRVAGLIQQIRAGRFTADRCVLIEGRQPSPGTAGGVILCPSEGSTADAEPDGPAITDFHKPQIRTARAGEKIAVWTPPEPGSPGEDVFGQPVPPESSTKPFALGTGVQLADDGVTVLAAVSGRIHLTEHELAIIEVVDIEGDVDYSTGNVESPTDVLIRGYVREGFKVSSARGVGIRGVIEAAVVEAATDIEVGGGIAAGGQGWVRAGGHVRARFCEDARVEAGGDIIVTRQVLNSRLSAGGRLLIPAGILIGGYAYARQGAEIAVLGNEVERRTELAVGLNPQVLAEAAAIDAGIRKRREAAAKIREKVQPLLAQLKRLTPAQREKATELMYQADELDAQVAEQLARREQILAAAAPPEPAVIFVNEAIFPGVRLIFGDKMTILRQLRRGRLRIEQRRVGRVEEIVLIDRISGSVTTLPAYEYTPAADPRA